ncbi:FmdB family zinc ribbon protein [Poseidonocella sp. HB161398]|uniref:FmdB family zinc ribbon protein n=1 Tax=Poseidonocella sp. HB161398 TaxID=2320855 RepID=UPI0011094DB4|nr:zinc ribbon domain-containing protein [Poseidonocella sp. HB161398]
MPVYDYDCPACGPFEALQPMSAFAAPCTCPVCAAPAPRVLRTAPQIANMDGGRRRAHAVNEKSADSPRRASHGPGCSCCSGGGQKKSSGTLYRPDGSKSFPKKRPWMISH